MGVFTPTGITHRARGGSSTAAIGNASVLAVKGRIRADDVRSMADYESRLLIEIGDMAGVDRCSIRIYYDPDSTPDRHILWAQNGTNDAECAIDIADISDGEWLHIYADFGHSTTGTRIFVEDDSGNALGTYSQADWDTGTIGASGSGNGLVSIGQGVDAPVTDAWEGQNDGWAVFSGTKADADRHDEPVDTDTDIEGYWPFPTSGSTATDQVGSQTLTIAGTSPPDFASGGAWDEPATGQGPVSADGVSTATVSVVRTRHVQAAADGVSAAVVSVNRFAGKECVARADGVSSAAVSVHRTRHVQAAAAGVSAVVVSLSEAGGGEVFEATATAQGQSSTEALVYVVTPVPVSGEVDGVSTVVITAVVVVSAAEEQSATAAGLSTASVSVSARRALTANADGVATASANPYRAGIQEHVALGAGVSTVAVSITVVEATQEQTASAAGLSSVVASMNVVRALQAAAAGLAVATAPVTKVDGSSSAAGKFAPQHARAYALIRRMGGV